ncbi:8733_t:CDS:2, partial [Entrophospora sp. SA101]
VAAYITLTTPRGPHLVQPDGRLVFATSYCSLLDFLLFSTLSALMHRAYNQGKLDDQDLDALSYEYRASTLYNKIKKWRGSRLLFRLFKANKSVIIIQISFSIAMAALFYAPMVFVYRFLEAIQLEDRSEALEWGFIYLIAFHHHQQQHFHNLPLLHPHPGILEFLLVDRNPIKKLSTIKRST